MIEDDKKVSLLLTVGSRYCRGCFRECKIYAQGERQKMRNITTYEVGGRNHTGHEAIRWIALTHIESTG
jgi:hypothetical protein